MRCFWRIDIKH